MRTKTIKLNRSETQLKLWSNPEYRLKMSEKHRGIKQSAEQIAKRVVKYSGDNHWTKRKKFSAETKEKMRQAKLKNPTRYWLGKKITVSEATKQKLRIASIRNGNKPPIRKGPENNLWKGGITPINIKLRSTMEYKLWREAVLKRDKYTCLWCFSKENLEVDHIKKFADYPELRFAIDNGRVLCKSCHKTTNTYKNKKPIYEI